MGYQHFSALHPPIFPDTEGIESGWEVVNDNGVSSLSEFGVVFYCLTF
jgi:hypothetical protein